MRQLFVIDPIHALNPSHDSSVALMEAAQGADDEVWITTIEGLGIDTRGGTAHATPIELTPIRRAGDHWVAADTWWQPKSKPATMPLESFRLIWMRTDPPVDGAYLRATYLLDLADPEHSTVINRPAGLRSANEKLFPLRFRELLPPTIVSNCRDVIERFVDVHGTSVLKPLDGMAGRGILLLQPGDPNLASIVDTSTQRGVVHVMIQAFIPDVSAGDRRVIVVGGEPLGVVRRIASGGDFRCNMAAGANVEADQISAVDREICNRIRRDLLDEGLYFVGLDVIGDRVTEINVTSPTGLREIDLLNHTNLAPDIITWATERFAGRGSADAPNS